MITLVTYKDLPFAELPTCEHMRAREVHEIGNKALAAAVWEQWRGKTVEIDTDEFYKGPCAECDCWATVPEKVYKGARAVAFRCRIEIGD